MPEVGAIVWAAIGGLILVMLGIIGYLVKSGFEGIKAELLKIWDKLDNYHSATETVARELAELKARCDERHK